MEEQISLNLQTKSIKYDDYEQRKEIINDAADETDSARNE